MDLFRVSFPTFTETRKAKLDIILYSKGVITIFFVKNLKEYVPPKVRYK